GSLGSAQRLKYTVIGDTVNTASRLESFDKNLYGPDAHNPCRILIGGTTFHLLGHQFQAQEVGEVSLKGKDEKVAIYRVLGRDDRSSSSVVQEGRG
ncbi:MAG: adenylate/guanylate cyclase domain-containing protein, partial [Candidatus Methylomirabilales bacterium]